MRFNPRLTPEEVEGYKVAAEMAEGRIPFCELAGRPDEVRQWKTIASYCRNKAASGTRDDDQTEGQRRAQQTANIHPPADLAKPRYLPPLSLMHPDELKKGHLKEAEWLALELALGYLSPRERVCFVAKFGGGLVATEIGKALGISTEQTLVHLKRAEKKMETKAHPLAHLWKSSREVG
jgi:DNA-directed RNA polymerase specialized sigma24 family protein